VQEWTEQVFVVRSDSYRQALLKGLDGRLQRATDKLLALTPPPARGKHQFRDETELRKAADAILKAHAVEGLLFYTLERQEKRQTKHLSKNNFRTLTTDLRYSADRTWPESVIPIRASDVSL
jgi:transposase